MAEEKNRKHPKADRRGKAHHPKKQTQPALTPEQAAALKAAFEKAEAEQKAEKERLRLWEANVEKLSVPQLRGEIRRGIRREHTKIGKGVYEPVPGLSIAFLTVFDTLLSTTKTLYNRNNQPIENRSPFAALSCYVR